MPVLLQGGDGQEWLGYGGGEERGDSAPEAMCMCAFNHGSGVLAFGDRQHIRRPMPQAVNHICKTKFCSCIHRQQKTTSIIPMMMDVVFCCLQMHIQLLN